LAKEGARSPVLILVAWRYFRRQLVAVSDYQFQIGEGRLKSAQFRLKLIEVTESADCFVIVIDNGQGIHVLLDFADDLRIESPFTLKPFPDR